MMNSVRTFKTSGYTPNIATAAVGSINASSPLNSASISTAATNCYTKYNALYIAINQFITSQATATGAVLAATNALTALYNTAAGNLNTLFGSNPSSTTILDIISNVSAILIDFKSDTNRSSLTAVRIAANDLISSLAGLDTAIINGVSSAVTNLS
jgi:hypothetical protein